MPRAIHWLRFAIVAACLFAFDQAAKGLVVTRLAVGETWTPIPALEPFLKIAHSQNSGAAFSIFQGNNGPLLALSTLMAFGILYYHRQIAPGQRLERFALGILFGGVLSNILDRARFGTVIDFVQLGIPGVISNISNFADHAIVLGVILLLLAQVRATRYATRHETPALPPARIDANGVRDPDAHP